MKPNRNADVGEEDLTLILSNLLTLEKEFIEETKLFMSIGGESGKGKIHTMDLFISDIVNRAISLIHGYILLAKEKNYISAVPLIRIQLDNCLRFYASTLVSNYDEFFKKYLGGEHIREIKDSNGKKMTDTYLVKQLDKNIMPGVYNVYDNTSGFIHLSSKHSFLHTETNKEANRTINIKIGKYDYFKIDEKVDFSYNMFVVTNLLLKMISSWKDLKQSI